MPVSVLSPPAALPVTLSGVKRFLRIDHTEDDELLTQLAQGATAHVEAHIKQSLINRTVRQYVDELPLSNKVELESWPVREVVQVTGFNYDGEPEAFGSAACRLDKQLDPAVIVFNRCKRSTAITNGYEIDLITGYGETGADIPSNIIQAVHRIISHWYEFRGASGEGIAESVPSGIEKLLAPVRRLRL